MFLCPSNFFPEFFKRPAVCGLAVAGLFCVLSPAHGQRAGGEKPSRFMNRIDAEEGARRLDDFRRQRLDGDYCFEFELAHKPHDSSRTIRYRGIMWGSWNAFGPVTRFRVFAAPEGRATGGNSPGFVELIVQNGTRTAAWYRPSSGDVFQVLEGASLFEPILPGMLYSPFDLQMPFVYWDDFVYEGPTLVGASRVAQQFLMLPPEGSASAELGIAGVRVGLDEIYNALWRIEVMDTDGEMLSRFAVRSFQKVRDQYIVKRISLTDYPVKDRTTFEVKAAAVGLSLDPGLFDANLAHAVDAKVPEDMEKL